MKTIKEIETFLAYKLLEWAGSCKDLTSFNSVPEDQRNNALEEAKHILIKLGIEAKEVIQ